MNQIPREDDIVIVFCPGMPTVFHPGMSNLEMTWSQWCENRDQYERAGFIAEVIEQKAINKDAQTPTIKAEQRPTDE